MLRFDCPMQSNIDISNNRVYYASSKGIVNINLENLVTIKSHWSIPVPVHLCLNKDMIAVSLKKSVLLSENNRERSLKIASTKIQWKETILSGVGRNFWMYDSKSDSITTVRTLNHQGVNLELFNDFAAISTVNGIYIYDVRNLSKPIHTQNQFGIQDIVWYKDNLILGCMDKIYQITPQFEHKAYIESNSYKLVTHNSYLFNVPLADRSCVQIYEDSNLINELYPTEDLIVDFKYSEFNNSIVAATDNLILEISTIPQSVQQKSQLKSKPKMKSSISVLPTNLIEEVHYCTSSIVDMHSILIDFSENIFCFEITASTSFLISLRLKVPVGYPKEESLQPHIENGKFGDLQQDLLHICKSFQKRGKRCMKEILEYVRQFPSRRITNQEDMALVEEKIEDKRDSEFVPFPTLCGFAFSPRGIAVFFSPIYLEKPNEKVGSTFVFRIGLQNHPRSFEMFNQFKAVAFKYLKETPKMLSPIGDSPIMSLTVINDIPGLLPSHILNALNFNVDNFHQFYSKNIKAVELMDNDISLFIWNSFESASILIEHEFCPNSLFHLLQQSVYRIMQTDDILLASLLAAGIALVNKHTATILKPNVVVKVHSIAQKLSSLSKTKQLDKQIPSSFAKIRQLLNAIQPLVERFVQLLQKFEMHSKKAEFLKLLNVVMPSSPYKCLSSSLCSSCQLPLLSNRCRRCSYKCSNLCSICQSPVQTLSYFCGKCHHGGHTEHIVEWFKTRTNCPTGCGCMCTL